MRLITVLLCLSCALVAAEPLRVVATVPELGAIARAVGGDQVAVTVLARPGDDPHHVEARPSFTIELARADLLVSTGFGLEEEWLKPLRENSGNERIRDDHGGHVQAQKAVAHPVGANAIIEDEHDHGHGGGHQHGKGNPHCLLDPAVGLGVAAMLADRFTALAPEGAAGFAARFTAFRTALITALAGPEVAAKAEAAALIDLDDRGALPGWLAQQGLTDHLGGWWGLLAPYRGAALAADHDLYPYLARRFGLQVAVLIEPEPGVSPSARRLAELTQRMREAKVRAILATPYFDRKVIDLLAKQGGLRIAELAHQAGALPGTEEYIAWIDADVRILAKALAP